MPAARLSGRGRRPRMFPRQDPSNAASSAPADPQPSTDAATPSDPAPTPTDGADPTTTPPTSDGEPTTSPQTNIPTTPSSFPSPTSDPPSATARPTSDPSPTSNPPTPGPPTTVTPTTTPPTAVPSTSGIPPTSDAPPTTAPPTTPPTTAPPTSNPPTSTPPTTTPPPTSEPPPSTPPTSQQPPTTTQQPPTTTEPPPTTTQQPPTTTEAPPPTSAVVTTDVPLTTTTTPPLTTVTSTSSTGTGTPTLVKTTMTSNGKTIVMTSTVAGSGGDLQSGQSSSGGSTDTNIGAIVGGVLGALAFIGALVAMFLFWRHRRRKQRYDQAAKMATRPSWTPLSPMVTGPTRSSMSEPYHDPYYEPFLNHDASGPCSTQPQAPDKIRSNPNSQYSQYSQLSTMDPTPESSTRALINPPTAGVGATIVGGGAALAPRPLSDATMEEHWKEAKMYQDFIGSGSGPVDRAGHNGTPTSSYAWGAASPKKRTLGMTNPDPETPDTPRSSYFDATWAETGGASGAAAAGNNSARTAAARSADVVATSVPKIASPPRPARDARRLSSPLLAPTISNDSNASVRSNPYKVVESNAAYNPYKVDARDAYETLAPAAIGPSSSSQPGVAITTAPGAGSSGAGRLAVNKGANLARQETLPKYEAEDERRFSGVFGDLKRDLIDRREE